MGDIDIMFYIVDYYGDYVFVFDSDDNSCEMVLRSNLKTSGVAYDFLLRKSIEPYKIKMIYSGSNSKAKGIIFDKQLVSYKLGVDSGRSDNDFIYVVTGLRVSETSCITNYRGTDKYVAVFYVISLNILYNFAFQWFRFNDQFEICGFMIPDCMIHYIMRLYRDKDSDKLFSAFDGLLTYRIARDRNIVSVYDMEWD